MSDRSAIPLGILGPAPGKGHCRTNEEAGVSTGACTTWNSSFSHPHILIPIVSIKILLGADDKTPIWTSLDKKKKGGWGAALLAHVIGRSKKALHQTWLDLGLKCGHQATAGHPLLTISPCHLHSGTMSRKVGNRIPRRGVFPVSAKTQKQALFSQLSTAKGMEHADWSGPCPVPTSLEEHGPRVGEISPKKKTQVPFPEDGKETGTRQRQ